MSNAFETWKTLFLAYLEVFSSELTQEIATKNSKAPFSLIGTALIYQAMRQQQRLVGGSEEEVIAKSVEFVKAMATPGNEVFSLCKTQLGCQIHQNSPTPYLSHEKQIKEMNAVVATALSVTGRVDMGYLRHIDAFVAWFALGVTYLVVDQSGDISQCGAGVSELVEELFKTVKTTPLLSGEMLKKHSTPH